MQREEIAVLIEKINKTVLDDNKNDLLHLVVLKQTAHNAILQITLDEKIKQDAIAVTNQDKKKPMQAVFNEVRKEIESIRK